MKFYKFLLSFVIVMLFTACGGGASRGLNSNAYGNFQTASTLVSNYPISTLQALVPTYGYCFGVDESSIVFDNTLSRTGTALCTTNATYIQNSAQASLFGTPNLATFVTANTESVTSVNMYKIIYNTPGQAQIFAGGASPNETVSGLVLVPNTTQTIKGVVLYYHGTVFSKTGVPSNPSSEGAYTEWLLSAVYASQGYIVVVPDYIGQGVDVGAMHPYVLYTTANALSGLNMLTATNQFLATQNIAMPSKLYISSYSEGGAYALWASRLLQGQYANILTANNLTLKRTAGISGAYNLSGKMIPYAYDKSSNAYASSQNTYNASPGIFESSPYYLSESIPIASMLPFNPNGAQQTLANFTMAGSKASLATYAFTSFIMYNYNPAVYTLFFASPSFVNMTSCMNIESYINVLNSKVVIGACPITTSLANLFMNPSYSSNAIGNNIVASTMATANYFTSGESNVNNITASVYRGGLTANSIGTVTTNNATNPYGFAKPILSDNNIMPVIRAADTWQFSTGSPLSLIYMNYDSTVTNQDSLDACSASGVKGMSATNMVTCLPVDNTQLYSAQVLSITGFGNVNVPLLLDHAQAEFTLNMVALHQFEQTP